MKVHLHVLEVSVIDTHPTSHMVQIKMDFHCFDSSTAINTYTFTSTHVYVYHIAVLSCQFVPQNGVRKHKNTD